MKQNASLVAGSFCLIINCVTPSSSYTAVERFLFATCLLAIERFVTCCRDQLMSCTCFSPYRLRYNKQRNRMSALVTGSFWPGYCVLWESKEFRPNKLYTRFLVPCLHPLTAGRMPCAHAQLNYLNVAFWMYIHVHVSSVATRDYIAYDRRKLKYVTVTFWKNRPWLCETTLQTK